MAKLNKAQKAQVEDAVIVEETTLPTFVESTVKMENYYYFNGRNGLFITLNGWEKIFKENGLSIKTSASDGYVFVNIIDKEGKNNLYKYSKAELTDYIEKTTKNLELFKKEPLQFMKMKAQRIAIDAYLSENNLFF